MNCPWINKDYLSIYQSICKAEINQSYKKHYIRVIDQVLRQDGWVLAVLFVFASLWTEMDQDEVEVHKLAKK